MRVLVSWYEFWSITHIWAISKTLLKSHISSENLWESLHKISVLSPSSQCLRSPPAVFHFELHPQHHLIERSSLSDSFLGWWVPWDMMSFCFIHWGFFNACHGVDTWNVIVNWFWIPFRHIENYKNLLNKMPSIHKFVGLQIFSIYKYASSPPSPS